MGGKPAVSANRIKLVYTGGTLGMVRSERGLTPSPNLRQLLDAKIPELGSDLVPSFDLITFGDAADSADFVPCTWYELAAVLREQTSAGNGCVVIQGTDTMAYTASALSYLLGDVQVPVILTGSQLPLGELRSDAKTNLLTALEVAEAGRIREVAVCFGHRVMRGNRVTKIRSESFDAFVSPNFPDLASVGTEVRYRGIDPPPLLPDGLVSKAAYRTVNIIVMPVYPGLEEGLLRSIANLRPEGLILECYGSGTFPGHDRKLLEALAEVSRSDTVVVALTQCLTGGASLERYATGRVLVDYGVLSGMEMTREAAYTKLHYLSALGLSKSRISDYMGSNLRGEIGTARH
ncbi:MAG: asparaginase [Xanthomonadales bacterium]|nr:asparaginase [Xanthomonadales bacterium]